MTPPSPEQQRRTMAQLHSLLASQVESYHRSRHMAPSTSISTELARELMDSLLYSLDQAGGPFANPDAAQTLRLGQAILMDKHQRSRNRLALIRATAPHRQTTSIWPTVVPMTCSIPSSLPRPGTSGALTSAGFTWISSGSRIRSTPGSANGPWRIYSAACPRER